ncbi:hypothetical protein S40285_10605 [Stachybotrys chlorohalonatus IBT 40285]|uniref:RING-type domain-containing protein n=1 Tax=Stachybotrys chlorohalonatus (strain IBT 40285) TaxID=1283841 RepID=A0A084QWZ7_STAC4|nr:hypothetical protein S40285_10605 [Stachybotrys chlorohalonata IBT 40285]
MVQTPEVETAWLIVRLQLEDVEHLLTLAMSDTPDQSAQDAALALEWIDQGLSFDNAVEAAVIEADGRIPDQRVPTHEYENSNDFDTCFPPPSFTDFDSNDEAELLSQPPSEGHINAIEEFQAERHQLYLDSFEQNLDNSTLGVNEAVPAAPEQSAHESQHHDPTLADSEVTMLVDDTKHATQPDLPIYGDKGPLFKQKRSLVLYRVSSGISNPHPPAPRAFNWPRASSATEGESAAVKAWKEAIDSERIPRSVCKTTQRRDHITQVLCGHDVCRVCLIKLSTTLLRPRPCSHLIAATSPSTCAVSSQVSRWLSAMTLGSRRLGAGCLKEYIAARALAADTSPLSAFTTMRAWHSAPTVSS